MAIFSTFANAPADAKTDRIGTKGSNKGKHFTQVNNMWSAWHHGTSYGAGRLEWFKENVTPSVFRYQKGQTTTS